MRSIWSRHDLGNLEREDFFRWCYGKGSSPPAPDPVATANAQAAANRDAVIASAEVNQINEVGPYGERRYSGEIGGPDRTVTTSLTPGGQNAFDIQERIAQQLGHTAEKQAGFFPQDKFNLEGLPQLANVRTPQNTSGRWINSETGQPTGPGGNPIQGKGAGAMPGGNQPGGGMTVGMPSGGWGGSGGGMGATIGPDGQPTVGHGVGQPPTGRGMVMGMPADGWDGSGGGMGASIGPDGQPIVGHGVGQPPTGAPAGGGSSAYGGALTPDELISGGAGRALVGNSDFLSAYDRLPQEHTTTEQFDAVPGKPENVRYDYTEGGDFGGVTKPYGYRGEIQEYGNGTFGAGGVTYTRGGGSGGPTLTRMGEGTPARSEDTVVPGANQQQIEDLLRADPAFASAVQKQLNMVGPGGAPAGGAGGQQAPNQPGQPPVDINSILQGKGAGGQGAPDPNAPPNRNENRIQYQQRTQGGQNELANAAQPYEQAIMDANMRLINPQYDRLRDDARADLEARGMAVGDEAYNRVIREQNEDYERMVAGVSDRAVIGGRAEQSRLFGLTQAARQQGIQERLLERTQPINELSAILQGSPATGSPQFSPAAQYNVNPADTLGATNMQFNAQAQAAQVKQQNQNATIGLIGTAAMAAATVA